MRCAPIQQVRYVSSSRRAPSCRSDVDVPAHQRCRWSSLLAPHLDVLFQASDRLSKQAHRASAAASVIGADSAAASNTTLCWPRCRPLLKCFVFDAVAKENRWQTFSPPLSERGGFIKTLPPFTPNATPSNMTRFRLSNPRPSRVRLLPKQDAPNLIFGLDRRPPVPKF